MGVKQERRDTQSENGDPEIDQIWCPDRQSHIEQRDQSPHAKVDTRPCEPRKQDVEVYPRSREPTASSNVPSTAECQIAQD
jgi:hypothetical protein